MPGLLIAHDLGTSGNKAALYDDRGRCLAESFEAYPTTFPGIGWHEQRPRDWWQSVVTSTRRLLAESGTEKSDVVACGLSGHSLGVVPLDNDGRLLRESVPIWSDARAELQARRFFERYPEEAWYCTTGNGFPPALYPVFKLLWFRETEPQMFGQIHKVIGTKDYINYRLTGFIGTDPSYASGSGVFDLLGWKYDGHLLEASGLPAGIFPEIVPSTWVIGTLVASAAEELGLPRTVKVVSGGVDNSCMALGARCTREGRVYSAHGSSSWIAVTSAKPLIDTRVRPYVFAHVSPGLFTSAVSTFSSGSSFRWVRDHMCPDLVAAAAAWGVDAYDLMTAEAEAAPAGARGVLFNPNMAGGTALSPSPNIRGAFLGLDLSHSRADLIRACMEGIALDLRIALDALRKMVKMGDELLMVGGAGRSRLWRQIFADAFDMTIVKSNIDQQAAALGAAACAAVGAGIWDNLERADGAHRLEEAQHPSSDATRLYDRLVPIFEEAGLFLSGIGDRTDLLSLRRGTSKENET